MLRLMKPKTRLCVDHPLGEGQQVPLTREQAHYLFGVMRLAIGDAVALFNGRDGEWAAEITEAGKRGGMLTCVRSTAVQAVPPDLWLLFAPIKKTRTDFIVEKATEMGVRAILPVQTEFTNSERIRQDRLQAHAVEAAEQCGGTFVPQVHELQRLDRLLEGWDPARRIMFCDESRVGQMPGLPMIAGPWAVLIGPEGGFSDRERDRLHGMEQAHAVALGPRILRADTAAVAALTIWQTQLGGWQ